MQFTKAISNAKQVVAHWGRRRVSADPILAEIENGTAKVWHNRTMAIWETYGVKRADGRYMTIGVIVKKS